MQYVVDRANPHLGGNIKGGDPRTFYPGLWQWLAFRYELNSVLDVGCGEGQAMEFFQSMGMNVAGLDGLLYNVGQAHKHGVAILCDLTKWACRIPVDLVWCCEVVEHVPERSIENLLWTLSSGRVLAMTHAVPGQVGHHHVNCRDAEYWVEKLRTVGMELDQVATEQSRHLADGFWAATGMIFTRVADGN